MDRKHYFNWGFWDGYHSPAGPSLQDNPAYLAGYACGREQQHATGFDRRAQSRALTQFLQSDQSV